MRGNSTEEFSHSNVKKTKMLALALGLIFAFLIVGQAKGYNQNYFLDTNSSSSDFTLTGHVNVTADNGTCSTNVNVYADINGTSSYNYLFQLYVNGILTVENPSVTGSTPQTCIPVITGLNVNQTAFSAMARAKTFGTPVPVNLYLEFYTSCITNNGNLVIYSNETNTTNTFGNNMYMVGTNYFSNTDASHFWGGTNNIPSHCAISGLSPADNLDFGVSTIRGWYFMPFSSGRGNATIYWRLQWNVFGTDFFGIYDPDNNITTPLGFTNSTQTIFTTNLELEPYHDFVLYVLRTHSSGITTHFPPNIIANISDYTPTYVCSPWSNCTGNIQTRLCNDTGGVLPLSYQSRSCLAVNETIVLGFEEYFVPSDRYICQPNFYPVCSAFGNLIANVTVLYPNNPRWTLLPITPLYYIGTITSEAATQGTRSLKLWFIPQSPFSDQPFDNNGTIACGNTSGITFPELSLNVNSSFMASLDFTFPTQTMQLMYDVKRCPSNVVQYDGWCGKRCYSSNCTIPPTGWFRAALYNPVTNTFVFDTTTEATDNWTTRIVDLGSNVLTDQNYSLIFDVLPLPFNPTITQGNCVFFDNVRLVNTQTSEYDDWAEIYYNTTWSDLNDVQKQTVLSLKCVSGCFGNDFYTRTIQGLTCVTIVSLNTSTCIAQQAAIAAGNQSIYQPISSIANIIVNTATNQTLQQAAIASGFGFTLVFLTPIFWVSMFTIIVAAILSRWTKHKEIGVVGGILTLIPFTLYGAFPSWLFIILIVVAGYLIGREVVGTVSGK